MGIKIGNPFEKIAKAVEQKVQTAVKTVEKTVKTVEQKATSAVHAVEQKATSAVHAVEQKAATVVKTAQHTADVFEQKAANVVHAVEQKAANVVHAVEQKAANVVHAVEQKAANTVHAVEQKAAQVVQTAEQTVKAGTQNLEQKLHEVTQKVADTVKPVVDTVKPVVQQGVDFVQATVDSMQQAAGLKPTPDDPLVMRKDQGTSTYGTTPQGQLFVNGASANDIRQGGTGDCYFLSSMASLAQNHPEQIQNAIKQNPDGTYTVTFHVPPGFDALKALGPAGGLVQEGLLDAASAIGLNVPGKTVQVTVDGDLPLDQNGNPVYSKTPGNETWVPIMEKAYAKLWGSYGAIGSGGDPATAMRALTGGQVTHHGFDNPLETLAGINVTANSTSPDKVNATYNDIKAATDAGQMVVAATYGNNAVQSMNGIVGGHAYTVMGVSEENGQKYVTVRNPWGSTEAGNDGNNDGVFKLPMEQFMQQFSGYDVGEVPNR